MRRLGVLVHPGGEPLGVAQHLADGLGLRDEIPAVPGQIANRSGPAQLLVDRGRVVLELRAEQVEAVRQARCLVWLHFSSRCAG